LRVNEIGFGDVLGAAGQPAGDLPDGLVAAAVSQLRDLLGQSGGVGEGGPQLLVQVGLEVVQDAVAA
jgi:hypothetical protein